ncbi:hypothetical protein ACFQ4O_06805 [Methylopila musalis]|uniref:DUF2946 domain-containing protein n=1 Tax=Methylopila musalis TaxID=1134781 RepID=A0ABW3Z613_9HYPH
MGIGPRRRRFGWLRRFSVVALAYLLVAQAALASVAPFHVSHQPLDPFSVLCAVADHGAAAGEHHAPTDGARLACCGIGCVGAAHFTPAPTAPDTALRYPSDLRATSPTTVADGAARRDRERVRSPRGPPATA